MANTPPTPLQPDKDHTQTGAQIHSDGSVTFARPITIPDSDRPNANSPKLVEYLRQLYQHATDRLQQSIHSLIYTEGLPPTFALNFAPLSQPAKAGPSHFNNFTDAFAHYKGRLLLLGSPGSGKTYTLLAFARQAAVRRLQDPSAPVPILVNIHTWTHGAPIAKWAIPPGIPLDGQPLLYLLDGLDEVGGQRPRDPNKPGSSVYDPRTDFIHAAEKQLSDALLVVTIRAQDHTRITRQHHLPAAVTVQPLTDAQVQQYLDMHQQSDLWPAVQEIGRGSLVFHTPLVLMMLATAFAAGAGDLPVGLTLNQVIGRYIETRFAQQRVSLPSGEQLSFSQETTRATLTQIAGQMWQIPWRPELTIAPKTLQELGVDMHFTTFAQQIGLMQPVPNGNTRFSHPILRDYCALPDLLDTLYSDDDLARYNATIALGKIGELALPGLIEMLGEKNARVRSEAVQALGNIDIPVSVANLVTMLRDEDQQVRIQAARALGKLGHPAALPDLIDALRDEWQVCHNAAIALGQIGPVALPGLLELLGDSDAQMRSRAAYALGQVGDPAAVPDLMTALGDEDTNVRSEAAKSLEKINDPAALPDLLNALRDEDRWVRSQACIALGKIGDSEAIPALLAALRDEFGDVRGRAAESLGQIGDPGAVSNLLQALHDRDKRVRGKVATALGLLADPAAALGLLAALHDQDAGVRYRAAESLGLLKNPAVVPGLMQALGDESASVRYHVARALGQIEDPAAVPGLVACLNDTATTLFFQRVCDAAADSLWYIATPEALAALESWRGQQQQVEAG